MRPLSLLFSLILLTLTALPAAAQTCNLQMTVACEQGANGAPSRCTATTTNAGVSACAGEFIAGFFSDALHSQLRFQNMRTSIGLDEECLDSSEFGDLVPEAFVLCFGNASLAAGASFTATTDLAFIGASPNASIFGVTVVFDPISGDTRGEAFAQAELRAPTCTPSISAPPVVQSGLQYTVSWGAVSDPNTTFTVEESTTADFTANVVSQTTTGRSATFRHDVMTNTPYYYRVRANSCGNLPVVGPYSETVRVVVQSPPPPSSKSGEATVPFGTTTPVEIKIFIPGPSGKQGAGTEYTAKSDKSYITVTPPSGTIGPNGVTLTATVDPKNLPPGANTGTVQVTTPGGAPLANVPVSISLVTPVTPGGKSIPPPNALLIPVVTHASGFNATFLSDVRLTNANETTVKYDITMSPTRTDATQSSRTTSIDVTPGTTIALNDIVRNFFGLGATSGDIGFGALEIRPVGTSALRTYASSRTYASTAQGTFGQYVAAVPVTELATISTGGVPLPGQPEPTAPPVLSLQQVAQSSKFRTNLGIVEGSGTPASGRIRIVDARGAVLKEVPYSLLPGEHQQLDRFIQQNGIDNLEDGRIEMTIDSQTGAVTAYASVLDNITTDPLAVMPVDITQIQSARYVLPGMADLNNPGANFHSDIRVFNAGQSAVTVTPTFYPQGNGPSKQAAPITIGPREVKAIDNVLPTLFQATGTGGSIVLTTPANTSLVATGRTYSIAGNGGTFGQFIPGVTPPDGIGLGDPALQILQLEHSANFRTNVGIVELTGNPVKVKVKLLLPDSRLEPSTDVTLAPNEFTQLNGLIAGLSPDANTYNARVAVEVIEGSGRVMAYGSVIDNATSDPTYVPAQ